MGTSVEKLQLFPIRSLCPVQLRRVWIAPVWLQLDNGQPSFLKRLLSVCLAAQSFFFISSTKPSFPTELTAAINWLVSAVCDCVTLSSWSTTQALPYQLLSLPHQCCQRVVATSYVGQIFSRTVTQYFLRSPCLHLAGSCKACRLAQYGLMPMN